MKLGGSLSSQRCLNCFLPEKIALKNNRTGNEEEKEAQMES